MLKDVLKVEEGLAQLSKKLKGFNQLDVVTSNIKRPKAFKILR
jgi:hypothetical protein